MSPLRLHAPTYNIALTYVDRQECYGLDELRQLFDLMVKCQGQMNDFIINTTHAKKLPFHPTHLPVLQSP